MTILGFGAVAVVGIGGLVLGVILMVIWWARAPRFFRGETLPMRSADLVLEPAAAAVPTFGLPDSGESSTVIAPDLSNLSTGRDRGRPADGCGVLQGGLSRYASSGCGIR